MIRRISILLLIILGAPNLQAQQGAQLPRTYDQKLGIEVGAGLRVGLWIYNKGISDSSGMHMGYDRTHSTPLFPLELNLYYRIWRFKIGVGAGLHILTDRIMIATESRRGKPKVYPVSDLSVVHNLSLSLVLEGDLVQKKWFSVAPHLKLGAFWSNHTHPDKAELGFYFATEIGVTTEFRVGPMGIFFRPAYNNYRMFYKGENPTKKAHSMYGFGLTAGIRAWVIN